MIYNVIDLTIQLLGRKLFGLLSLILTRALRHVVRKYVMYYRFIVECNTNEPIETEVELQIAIDTHSRLKELNLCVTGRKLTENVALSELGKSQEGDRWHFFIEGEIDTPIGTLNELRRAVHRHGPISHLEPQVDNIVRIASPSEREQTVDDLEQWLREGKQKNSR